MVELNLKPWLSSGLVLAGESLSDRRQWDCLSFGERGMDAQEAVPAARGGRSASAMPCWVPVTGSKEGGTYQDKGDTYQDNWADVGWEQDVVPQWAPITLWLHVGGTLVVELEGQEEGMWNRRQLPCPDQEPRAGHAGTVDVPQPAYSP